MSTTTSYPRRSVEYFLVGILVAMMAVGLWFFTFVVPQLERDYDNAKLSPFTGLIFLFHIGKWIGGRLPDQIIPGVVWLFVAAAVIAMVYIRRAGRGLAGSSHDRV